MSLFDSGVSLDRAPWRVVRALVVALTGFGALALALPGVGHAAAKKVLFISLGGYTTDGVNAYNEVKLAAGEGNTTYVLLAAPGGQAAAALAADTYEQVWFYDLSTGTDAYTADYAAIKAWYDAAPLKEIICDGRFLSSFWHTRATTEGRALVENYYTNLDLRGGGIIIGTDDSDYSPRGANTLATTLGLNTFTGNFSSVSFPLDADHPLATTPNVLTSLSNDSSTGQAPFGVQPGGRTLRTVGYHSGNPLTPGISTTIDGGVLGITVEVTTTGGDICTPTLTLEAAITSGGEFSPFTYAWYADGVAIGTTNPLTVTTTDFTDGAHTFRVVATGAGSRADDDAVDVTFGAPICTCGAGALDLCDAGGAVFVLAVDGAAEARYVMCRLVPAGEGSPPATAAEFRCDDANQDGVADLFTAAEVTSYYGAGFCGMP